MKKKILRFISFVTAACLCFLLSGCWDYRGLNELTIVAGFALDVSDNGGFLLSIEVIDPNNSNENMLSSKIIQVEGVTVSEAVYNISKQFYNNLYFGNADVAIFSKDVVKKNGLGNLIDPLLRNNSVRDNLTILISGEKTAVELIEPNKGQKKIMSFDINNKLLQNQRAMAAILSKELYEVYGTLCEDISDLALPSIRFKDGEKEELEMDGLAVFDNWEMVGFLGEEDIQHYLLVVDALTSGGLVYEEKGVAEEGEDAVVTVEIRKSTPSLNYEYKDGRFSYSVKIEMVVAMAELSANAYEVYGGKGNDLEKLKLALQDMVETSVKGMVKNYQKAGLPDTLGFADKVYYSNPKLWEEVKEDWQTLFQEAEVDVSCKLTINDTGLIKRY